MSSETITRNDLVNIIDKIVAIDGTDMTAQEIDDFVNSLNVTGIHAVDYVVEQGTDNSWTYRKWNSGLFEAWRYYQASSMTITTSSAGTYYGGEKLIPLPSFVVTITGTTYGNAPSQSSGVYIYETVRDNSNLKVVYRAHASTSNASCGGVFHIFGTWK